MSNDMPYPIATISVVVSIYECNWSYEVASDAGLDVVARGGPMGLIILMPNDTLYGTVTILIAVSIYEGNCSFDVAGDAVFYIVGRGSTTGLIADSVQ